MLLNVSKLEKAFGDDVLFEDVSFSIEENEKIGFVGVNGSGKTTLFKAILDERTASGGEIFKNKYTKIGYMQQHVDVHSELTVWEELMSVYSDVEKIEAELEKIARDISNQSGDINALIERQTSLTNAFEQRGGYYYKSIAKSALMGLGFKEEDFNTLFENLSGGQKTRVLLCKILLSDANLLLLDEPTNHLDISSVQWLEDFLRDYKGAFVVISHDRYFLDKVTNKTFEFENRHLTVFKTNYTGYIQLKAELRKAAQSKYDNTVREIERIEGIIEQQKRWNREKNIKTAESKQKIIDRLEKTLERPDDLPEGISFKFPIKTVGGNDVLFCRNLAMAYGINKLFSGLNLDIYRKENVFLLGPNGCGKTTLFKLITDKLKPIDGEIKLGANVFIGYYDQNQQDLDYSKTVFDEVYDAYPAMTQTEIRNALAGFLFKGDDVLKEISKLSGGERAKVSLLKLMLSGANFLLLDEPTNHLDIASREALEDALLSYEGTLFVVSHDRYFINKIAHRICVMSKDGLINYTGNYDYYLEKSADTPEEVCEVKAKSKDDYHLRKQLAAQERKRINDLKKTEDRIEELENKIGELKQLLETDEYATDYLKAQQLVEEIDALDTELSELYEKWEELS